MHFTRAKKTDPCPRCGSRSSNGKFVRGCGFSYPNMRNEREVRCVQESSGAYHSEMNPAFGKVVYYHLVNDSGSSQPRFQITHTEIANRNRRDSVYKALLTSELSPTHARYLETRNAAGRACQAARMTTLSNNLEVRDKIAAGLNDIIGVPGFWTDNRGAHLNGPGGLLIPIQSEDGLFVGCQINTDRAITAYLCFTARGYAIPASLKEKMKWKYIWLTSVPEPRTSREGNPYVHRANGVSAQAALHFPTFTPNGDLLEVVAAFLDPARDLLAVEGILKSNLVADCWQGSEVVCGLAGGSTSHDELALRSAAARRILLGVDADWRTNDKFRMAVSRCIDRIALCRSLDEVYILTWPENAAKGLDDLLISGQSGLLSMLKANQWRRRYATSAA